MRARDPGSLERRAPDARPRPVLGRARLVLVRLGCLSHDGRRPLMVAYWNRHARAPGRGVEVAVNPALYVSPTTSIQAPYGYSFGGFFGDYASSCNNDEAWGEGGLSFTPEGSWWFGRRFGTSYGELGS